MITRSPIRKRRAGTRRGPLRDKDYLEFLRRQCCALLCNCAGWTEAAHGPVNGMCSKGPDNEAIPLCMRHHREQHHCGINEFQRRYHFDWAATAKRYHDQYAAGRGN